MKISKTALGIGIRDLQARSAVLTGLLWTWCVLCGFRATENHEYIRWAVVTVSDFGVCFMWRVCCVMSLRHMAAVPGMDASRVLRKCPCRTWECRLYGGTPTTSRTRATTGDSPSSVLHASEPRSMTRHCSALSTGRLPTSLFLMCLSCKYWKFRLRLAVSRGCCFIWQCPRNPW